MQVVNAEHWFPAIKQANANIARHPLVLPRNGKGSIKKNHNQPTKEKNKQTNKPQTQNSKLFSSSSPVFVIVLCLLFLALKAWSFPYNELGEMYF